MRDSWILLAAASGPAILGASGIVFLKRAGEILRSSELSGLLQGGLRLLADLNFWLGVGLYAAAFIWLMLAMPYIKLTQFFPVAVGLNILFTTLAAVLFLQEQLVPLRILGVVLIVGGVALVAR